MKKILISVFTVSLLTGSFATAMAADLQVYRLTPVQKKCKQSGAQLVKRHSKSLCVVKSRTGCQRIRGKVSNIKGKSSCVIQHQYNPAVPGIEGTDIGSGG